MLVEQLVLVSPPFVRSIDDLAQVENLKVVVSHKDCLYRQRLSSILDGMGSQYKIMECSSLEAIITCISAGVGVTLLPSALVDEVWLVAAFVYSFVRIRLRTHASPRR
jgi:DNA-binding transcriptional LysR family regulator